MQQATDQTGFSVFISHASDDRAVAEKVCQQLESAGFRCWVAPRDVRPGEDYPSEIVRGIELSKSLVLILSRSANDSKFVRAEVERAYSKGKPIFPLRVEEVLPSRALELFVSTKHWIDAWQGDLSDHASRLARELANDPDLDMFIPGQLRRPARTRRLLQYGALLAGAAVIAVAVSYFLRPDATDLLKRIPLHQDRPVTAHFMGGMVTEGKPILASYMLTDGWNGKGEKHRAFDSISAFEVYEVQDRAPMRRIHQADPKQFAGQVEATQTYEFTIDGLPKKVVWCVAYRIPASGTQEVVVQGLNFTMPSSRFASFSITEAAEVSAITVSGSSCIGIASSYAVGTLRIKLAS